MTVRKKLFYLLVATLGFTAPTAWAAPFTVSVDISSIGGSDFELLIELFDNDLVISNSSVLIDNVSIQDAGGVISPPGVIDFESGGFEGFVPDPLAPSVTSIVPGGFTGGTLLLELGESLSVNPTLTFRDFLPSTATTLQFDFELVTPSAVDSVVFSIIDPNTFAPFPTFPDLFGLGDFLESTSSGNTLALGVTAEPISEIPEPSSIILWSIGTLTLLGSAWRRRKWAA